MIPIALASELKSAGLVWQTQTHDFFAIPDHGMDERVFVLADMVAFTELVQGWPAVAFHGTAEWALDYIFSDEIVWLPTEEQLREALLDQLRSDDTSQPVEFHLSVRPGEGYRCAISFRGAALSFDAPTAGEAYAHALLHVLSHRNRVIGV
jgi:hypothetical protein